MNNINTDLEKNDSLSVKTNLQPIFVDNFRNPIKDTEVYWPKLISLAHLKVFNKVTGIWPKYDAT